MARPRKSETRVAEAPKSLDVSCCKIDALVTVDGRGQLLLPKELRQKAGIRGGDKLAVISWERDGEVCCITLMKADDFAEPVKGMLGPIMKGILE
ncbi:MAG: HgcAB-associated protein [Desulfobacteraceae bacterium]|jgi:AbrB family looped-hinge helix DNA binding protein